MNGPRDSIKKRRRRQRVVPPAKAGQSLWRDTIKPGRLYGRSEVLHEEFEGRMGAPNAVPRVRGPLPADNPARQEDQ